MEEDAQIKIFFVLSKTVVFLLSPSNFHCLHGCRYSRSARDGVFPRSEGARAQAGRALAAGSSAAHMHWDWPFRSGRFFLRTVTVLGHFAIPVHRSIRLLAGRNACKSNDATASSPGIAAKVAVLVVAAIAVLMGIA